MGGARPMAVPRIRSGIRRPPAQRRTGARSGRATLAVAGRRQRHGAHRGVPGRIVIRRLMPTIAAALLAIVYVSASPPSLDLAAHLFRAKLFSAEGFGIWNNWWYAGHHVPGYSVLFPPIAALLTPQIA